MQDISQIIEKQKNYLKTNETKSVSFRIGQLKKLKQAILDNQEKIVESLAKDLHKSEFETYETDIFPLVSEIRMFERNLKKWAKPRKVFTPPYLSNTSSKYQYEPYGSVLIISAWNYPFYISLLSLANALAAGNCAVLKPSELAPNSSALIREIIEETFDEKYCAVVEGGVQETTELLRKNFDFIFYTGSTKVGKIVSQEASKNLTPVILELGGKSPCIVDETANMELAAKRITWGKFLNAGQTCVAPDYVLVHESKKDELLDLVQKNIKEFFGDDAKSSPDFPRIINNKNFLRLKSLIDKDKVAFGGDSDFKELYIGPTIMKDVDFSDRVMQEEIFGPILPVISYSSLEDIVENVCRLEKPLSAYIFSESKQNQKYVIENISSGSISINSVVLHTSNPNIPFGGVGKSGYGRYHGRFGFESLSNKKSILRQYTKFDLKFCYPPYHDKIKLIKLLTKYF